MATTVRPARPKPRAQGTRHASRAQGIKYVSRQQGAKILDRQARKYLGMSGDEFVRRYRAGEIEDPDRSAVVRLAMLIPLSEP
jgi:hypothetical protein